MKQVIVSIHAPTWGATMRSRASISVSSFNSRAHVGRDKGVRDE